ncbi:MAG: periplasmic heavy metal sensor [Flavobacteriales bacterium]|nr:MAG: periplasmic heavy metal sensor [Flavobacteriales bacterium]
MKHLIFALLIFAPFLALAQGPRGGGEKMEARKVAWLTTKLDLSAEDAKIFWPIYNDYVRELSTLRKERSQKMISFRKLKEIEDLDDEEIQSLILNDFNFRQRDLNIERKYYNKFKSNLPIKTVGKFYRAQEAFKKEILQQYRASMPAPQTN